MSAPRVMSCPACSGMTVVSDYVGIYFDCDQCGTELVFDGTKVHERRKLEGEARARAPFLCPCCCGRGRVQASVVEDYVELLERAASGLGEAIGLEEGAAEELDRLLERAKRLRAMLATALASVRS